MHLKNDRMISVHFEGKPFNITVIHVYAPTSNAEEAEIESFYLLELTPKKDVLFFIVQLLHPYMTTGETIALARWTLLEK